MKTLVLEQPGRFSAAEAGEPAAPGPGHALVRVHRVGVCGTDLHAFAGRQPFFDYPRIPGHELGLEVLAVGEDTAGVNPGDRCALEPYVNCGTCIACRRGRGNCCAGMRVIGVHSDGGMRERFVVPARKLHPANGLDYDQLALVEPLAIGCHAVDRAGVEAGEYVLVIGAGPIGLAVLQFVIERGARAIVLDINDARLEFCRRQFDPQHLVDGRAGDVAATLSAITGGDLPTAVLDATGSPRSMAAAFGYVSHGGRLVFVGLFQGDLSFNDPEFHKRELTLMASRNARAEDFRRILGGIESGRIGTGPWITHRAAFDDVPARFREWTNPETGVIKAMIEVG